MLEGPLPTHSGPYKVDLLESVMAIPEAHECHLAVGDEHHEQV